jgi:hypothetical protein
MVSIVRLFAIASLGLLLIAPALAEDATGDIGGDHYSAGQSATASAPVKGDAFLAGYDTAITAPITGNAHAAGFNVGIRAAVDGDLYGAGYAVTVDAPIRGSATLFGNSITLGATGQIGRNARLYGASVHVDGPILGSALIGAETLTLNGPVTGDLVFTGRTISFGANARVSGRLTLETASAVAVPESVASADRVSATLLPPEARSGEHPATSPPQAAPLGLAHALPWWVATWVIGAITLALMPKLRPALEAQAAHGAWRKLGWGLAGFAATIGAIPLLAITIVGLLLLPFALVLAALLLIIAHALGAYLIAFRLLTGWRAPDNLVRRLAVLALGVLTVGVVGLLPVIGWIVGLVVTAYGLGALIIARLPALPARPDPVLAAPVAA